VISDIVSDEEVPDKMQNDPELWSGCISGAFTEEGFLAAFEKTGFSGIQILKRDATAWRTVQGIEFRSITIEASKGKQDTSSRTSLPHPKETKSQDHEVTTKANDRCCNSGGCSC
jgi:hypothetical protein